LKKIVFIATLFPEANATAAGWRIIQLIEILKNNNYEVHFIATSSQTSLNPLDGVYSHLTKVNCKSFDDLIGEINPEIVFFDRFIAEEQFGWRVSACCPQALKILDSEDLHFLRKEREDLYLKKQVSEKTKAIFLREMASMMRCDLTIIISIFEYQLLVDKYKFPESQLFYLPFFSKVLKQNKILFQQRRHFVFIGNFLHEPNWQTVLVLKRIWSKIRSILGECELHIYGAYMPEKAKNLHDVKNGFLMKGFVERVESLFSDYRVLLAPIPYGAGLKGKLFESFVYGLPNVTSPFGAEGLCFDNLWNGFITNNDDDFVKFAVALYDNENIWQEKQSVGFQIVEKHFKKEHFQSLFLKQLIQLLENIDYHREENYLIGVLNHQSLQSTKYMSKWIEEKEKNRI